MNILNNISIDLISKGIDSVYLQVQSPEFTMETDILTEDDKVDIASKLLELVEYLDPTLLDKYYG